MKFECKYFKIEISSGMLLALMTASDELINKLFS